MRHYILFQKIKKINKYNKIMTRGFKTGKATRFEDTVVRYSEYLKLSIEKNTNFMDSISAFYHCDAVSISGNC